LLSWPPAGIHRQGGGVVKVDLPRCHTQAPGPSPHRVDKPVSRASPNQVSRPAPQMPVCLDTRHINMITQLQMVILKLTIEVDFARYATAAGFTHRLPVCAVAMPVNIRKGYRPEI